MSQELSSTKSAASPSKVKYKIKASSGILEMPGFPNAQYTDLHLNGDHGDMIVRAMKKKNADLFAKLVEELK